MRRCLFRKLAVYLHLPAFALLSLLLLPLAAQAQPSVVGSIKPLQLIAGAITDGVSEPELLIPANQSYHHFTLRPSDIRRMTGADLLIWVGPELETYMADTVFQLDRSGRARVITVSRLSDITRHGPAGKALIQAENGAHHHGEDGQQDPHLWLDSRNAERLAVEIAEALVEIDPDHARHYEDNLQRFREALALWREQATARMEPLLGREYAVYHSAFQYFEREHGLSPQLIFVQDDELQPGMRQLLMVRRELENQSLHCLLEDVTANPATIRTALGQSDLPRVQADTMGGGLPGGPDAYIGLLEQLVDAYERCLSD